MLNSEKFKTAEERAKACKNFLRRHGEYDKIPYIDAAMMWLELEAGEDEPLPCPFCGSKCEWDGLVYKCTDCQYKSSGALRKESAIAAHNRVAKAVIDAKESKVK